VNFADPCFNNINNGGPGCAVSPINTAHWLLNDTTAAALYGTPYAGAPRNTLRGQPISTANLAVFKTTRLNEKVSLQFQAQAFNVMNVQFLGVPDPVLDHEGTSFQNTHSNVNGGASSSANLTYDGIGRRRLLFGMKVIF